MSNYLQETIKCKGTKICSPFVREINGKEVIGYVSSGTGEVFAYSEGKHVPLTYTGGEPFGAVFDAHGKIHIADCAHGAILRADLANHSHQPGIVVKVYEEKPFRGPSSIAISPSNITYFTDSGPMGETTIEQPRGSVYCIAPNPSGGHILKPLAMECLAHPCAVAVSPNSKLVYVAEMMNNRILRFVQRPSGIYHMSVFHQFSGDLGPSCLACDTTGRIYVGSFDIAGGTDSTNGRIYILSPQGIIKNTLEVPGQEITGLCVEATHKLYVTEATTNSLHCISLDTIVK
ncbi:hypothetical protein THRCLA_06191 [Thraustotheca clavata]|uniref:SMP-30/Gluconolactonase/LRE-like region domain-containing protein n=1 Tax=Thraustotheca clavata TaxID=74557 RepID=A0A1V9ZQ54_9STRA|nr:hypothetical protein THRCLA_06191 [Thraustotheca clavata]